MTTVGRTTTQGKDQEVVNGIEKELYSMQTLHVGGASYTPQTLVAYVLTRTEQAAAILTARAAWEKAISDYDALDKRMNVTLADLRSLVMAAFGRDTPKLASFGFSPPKPSTRTPEQRAKAALKGVATRKTRKTMGKKQKALVKGEPPAAAAPVSAPSETT
jgi:hypothetical protein